MSSDAAEVTYADTCDCGRTVSRSFTLSQTLAASNGEKRIRCRACRSIILCQEQEPGDVDE